MLADIILTVCVMLPLVGAMFYVAYQCDAIAASRREIDQAAKDYAAEQTKELI